MASRPEVVVAMPCGWDAEQASAEVREHAAEISATDPARIWAVDAAASFSRPGPRLVDGTELLAHLLHPDRVAPPAGVSFEEVRAGELAAAQR
jgi:iron complex transport system substrate-binding protein